MVRLYCVRYCGRCCTCPLNWSLTAVLFYIRTCTKLVEKARHPSLNKARMRTSTSSSDPFRDKTPSQASGTGATRCSGQVLQGSLFPSYFFLRKRDVPYKLKYASADNDKLTSPPQRSLIIPPAALQRVIFPFIEDLFPGNADWVQWIDNIMMDQDEGANRVVDWRKGYQELDCAETIRLALVLAHLRKVVLQDYVVLTASDPDELNLNARHHLARQHRSFLTQPFKEFTIRLRSAILTKQAPVEVEDDGQMSELGESNAHPSKMLATVSPAVPAVHASQVSVAAGTGQLKASTAAQGHPATLVVDSTSINPFPARLEITPSINAASDQGPQHRNGTATVRNYIRYQEEGSPQDPTKSFPTPAATAPCSSVVVLDRDSQAEIHGQDNSPTHRSTTPTTRPATAEELFRGDASPILVASTTSTNQSPTETTSINMQTTNTERNSTAELDEHKSPLSKLSDQFSPVIEATLTTMSNRFLAELKATRATMMSQLAEELEVTRTAMKSQLATEFETAREDMRSQLSEELEETRMSINNQLSEEFVTTQASVDGVHLRMAEIERSIRGLWTTMAAERVNPRRSLLHANDNRESRSRSPFHQRPGYNDDDMQEDEQEEEVEYQGMQEHSDTMLQNTDDNEHITLQNEDVNNNGADMEVAPDQSQEKRRPIFTWPDPVQNNRKQNLDELSNEIARLYEQIPETRLRDSLKGLEMLPSSASVRSVWEEWFSAKNGKPSVWSLNEYHRQWRREMKDRTVMHYWLKRTIVQEVIKEVVLLSETMGGGRAVAWQLRQQQQHRMILEELIEKAMDIVQEGVVEAGSVWDFQKAPHTRTASDCHKK